MHSVFCVSVEKRNPVEIEIEIRYQTIIAICPGFLLFHVAVDEPNKSRYALTLQWEK